MIIERDMRGKNLAGAHQIMANSDSAHARAKERIRYSYRCEVCNWSSHWYESHDTVVLIETAHNEVVNHKKPTRRRKRAQAANA